MPCRVCGEHGAEMRRWLETDRARSHDPTSLARANLCEGCKTSSLLCAYHWTTVPAVSEKTIFIGSPCEMSPELGVRGFCVVVNCAFGPQGHIFSKCNVAPASWTVVGSNAEGTPIMRYHADGAPNAPVPFDPSAPVRYARATDAHAAMPLGPLDMRPAELSRHNSYSADVSPVPLADSATHDTPCTLCGLSGGGYCDFCR
jgi:hypothetical protein